MKTNLNTGLSMNKQKILNTFMSDIKKDLGEINDESKIVLDVIQDIGKERLMKERKLDDNLNIHLIEVFRDERLIKNLSVNKLKNYLNVFGKYLHGVDNFHVYVNEIEEVSKKLKRDLSEKEVEILIGSNLRSEKGKILHFPKINKVYSFEELDFTHYISRFNRKNENEIKIISSTPLFDGYYYLVKTINGEGKEQEYNIAFDDIIVKNNKKDVLNEEINKNREKFRRLNYFQTSLGTMLISYASRGIDFEPVYQRGFVWNQEDKEKLISSILIGKPIGSFVLYEKSYNEDNSGKDLEIIDGKQRFSTLIDFITGQFSYKGKFFQEFTQLEKNIFESCSVSVSILKGPLSLKERIETFLLVNETGKQVSTDVLDNARELLK